MGLLVCLSCADRHQGGPCLRVQAITAKCETCCEKDCPIKDIDACKLGCRWMALLAEKPLEQCLSAWSCGGLIQAQKCYALSQEILRQCVQRIGEQMTWDMEEGVFYFMKEMEQACYQLSCIQGE